MCPLHLTKFVILSSHPEQCQFLKDIKELEKLKHSQNKQINAKLFGSICTTGLVLVFPLNTLFRQLSAICT